jgi:hypothetical protein
LAPVEIVGFVQCFIVASYSVAICSLLLNALAIPIATNKGCFCVLFRIALYCGSQFSYESNRSVLKPLTSSVEYMPYCPVEFRPGS